MQEETTTTENSDYQTIAVEEKDTPLFRKELEENYGHRASGSSYTKRPESITIDGYGETTKVGWSEIVLGPLLLQC